MGLVSLSLKERKDDLQSKETARYHKLSAVTNYIKNNFPVGSIDSPNEYFEGTIPMRWGDYMDTGMVYFGGKTDKTWLGLAGSGYHIVGSMRGGSDVRTHSTLPGMVKTLMKAIDHDVNRGPHIDSWYRMGVPPDERKPSFLRTVVRETSRMQGPETKVEFLARKLNYGTRDHDYLPYIKGEGILLGTPIYVAIAEE